MVDPEFLRKYFGPEGIKAQRLCQFCDATPRFGRSTTPVGDSSQGSTGFTYN
jgi:hypothetical protein